MSSDKKKLASDCWRKGAESMARGDWDSAIEMFLMASRLEPHNLLFRQALRACEYRKYGDNRAGAGLSGEVKLRSIRSRINDAKSKSDWKNCDEAAEDGLVLYPWDAQLLADLGDAARGRGNLEIAVDSYKRAIVSARDNRDFRRTLNELLEELGE